MAKTARTTLAGVIALAFAAALLAGPASPAAAAAAADQLVPATRGGGATAVAVEVTKPSADEAPPTTEIAPPETVAATDGYGGKVSGGGAEFPILLVAGLVLVVGVLLVAVLRLGQKRRALDARESAKKVTDNA